MGKKQILNKANKEFERLSGFDLISTDEYLNGSMTLEALLNHNNQWLCDHVNDVERGITHHMRDELRDEDETSEEHIRRVTSDLMPTPECKE